MNPYVRYMDLMVAPVHTASRKALHHTSLSGQPGGGTATFQFLPTEIKGREVKDDVWVAE